MEKKYFVQLIGTRVHLFYQYVKELGCKVEIISKPEEISPKADICLASGVHYFVKREYLHIARLGIWGFHESPLPVGRGCAPIQWTVLNGNNDLVVSFFELIEKMDTGRLLGQERCLIAKTALLEDMRDLAVVLAKKLIDKKLIAFLQGKIQPYEQAGEAIYYTKRTPADSKLDTTRKFEELWDLIRVCDNKKFPAWFEVDGEKFVLERYRVEGGNI